MAHPSAPLRLLGLLLVALASSLLTCASSSSSCDASSSDPSSTCSTSASIVAAHDPYAPRPVAGDTGAPPNVMHLWTTPLFITRPKLRDTIAFNRGLSERALTAFQVIKERSLALSQTFDSNTDHRGDDAQGVNERFFQWQKEQHARRQQAEPAYLDLVTSKEFLGLHHMFDSYVVAYLESLGKDSVWQSQHLQRNQLFCWATVASEGNYHLSHTHPDNMISGVYYSRIPLGSGSIIFDDPRGPRAPFDGRWIHRPSAGELILFPSWLVHQVTSTPGSEPRISFSCNVPGAWEDLADVNLV